MKKTITPTPDGFIVEVGDATRVFETKRFSDSDLCERAAKKWMEAEVNFQTPSVSLAAAVKSATQLKALAEKVATDFPKLNSNYRFLIDEYTRSLGILFGEILVFEHDEGFNIELVTGFISMERRVICKNVSLEVAAEIVRNSERSGYFYDSAPREIHLSIFNVEMLNTLCEIEN